MPSTRRTFLAVGCGGLAALAGCTNQGTSTKSPSRSPSNTEPPTPATGGDDRSTQTPRDPTPLDVSGAWPQAGYDGGHAGVTEASGVPDSGEPYWRLRRVRSGPAVLADGRLFHFGKLGADPTNTPTVTRTRSTPGTAHPVHGNPALFARNASDGDIQWTREVSFRGSPPAVADDRLIVGAEGQVIAYHTGDGQTAWTRSIDGRDAATPSLADELAVVGTIRSGRGDRDPDVRAYRITDGELIWSKSSPKGRASIAISGETVVALSSEFQVGSVLSAYDLVNGSELWRFQLNDNGIPGGPVVAGETVYVSPDNQGLYAFDVADGSERWHYEAETTNRVGIAASYDVAYLVDDGRLRAVAAADGHEHWSVTASEDAKYRGVPAVGQEAIYLELGGFPADFVALSRSDGSKRWSYRLPETVVDGDMVMSGLAARPAVAANAVYAFAHDGLYAFGPAT